MLSLLLLIVAVLLLAAAGFGVPSVGRVNFLALGLACWAASQLVRVA